MTSERLCSNFVTVSHCFAEALKLTFIQHRFKLSDRYWLPHQINKLCSFCFPWCLFSFCPSLLLLSLLLFCSGCDEISHPWDFTVCGIPTHVSWSRVSFSFFPTPPGIFHICLVSNVCQLLLFYQNIRNACAPDKVPQWIVIGLHAGLPSRKKNSLLGTARCRVPSSARPYMVWRSQY